VIFCEFRKYTGRLISGISEGKSTYQILLPGSSKGYSAFYNFNNTSHVYYSARNSYRVPDYIRLDFAATFNGNLKASKLNHSSVTFTIYNVLNRQNPYSIYFRNEEGILHGYKLTIFGKPVVMLTYNFRIFGNATGDF